MLSSILKSITNESKCKPAKFKVQSVDNSRYYYALVSDNDKIMLKSDDYYEMQGVINLIASIKESACVNERFIRKTNHNGKCYFVMVGENYEIIGLSNLFYSEDQMERNIDYIRNFAPDAPISEAP